jgi:hypothetical protein
LGQAGDLKAAWRKGLFPEAELEARSVNWKAISTLLLCLMI